MIEIRSRFLGLPSLRGLLSRIEACLDSIDHNVDGWTGVEGYPTRLDGAIRKRERLVRVVRCRGGSCRRRLHAYLLRGGFLAARHTDRAGRQKSPSCRLAVHSSWPRARLRFPLSPIFHSIRYSRKTGPNTTIGKLQS